MQDLLPGRTLTDPERVATQVWLDRATAEVRRRVKTVDDRIADGTLDSTLVAGVVVDMVLRVLRNPDGKVSESIDDYTFRRADSLAAGALYMTDGEMSLLSPAKSRASSIKLYAATWCEAP